MAQLAARGSHNPKVASSILAGSTHFLQPAHPSRLAQSVERKTFNLVVVGSSPTVGVHPFLPVF